MNIDANTRRALIEAVAKTITENADKLTVLDQAIGDGDHGSNMKRGFEAVMEDAEDISKKALPDSLKALGMKLVMKVGGASGPLFGTLFMTLGKSLNSDSPSLSEFDLAFKDTLAAIKARGKSDTGQKTMLDVLHPLSVAISANDDLLLTLPKIADEGAEATIPMRAIKGRASFLGERSIGHMDPGSFSTALITHAVCETLNGVNKA